MSDKASILLLTRPEPQSRCFLAECEQALGRSIPAVISPVLKIEPVPHEIDFSAYETLIVTSRNAVEQVGHHLKGRVVAAVGARTTDAARGFGAEARCLGEDVDAFLKNASQITGPALHLRGVHSRGQLAERLSALGLSTRERVVYDQVEIALSEDAQAALSSGSARVAVFSPRSARLVSAYGVHPDTRVLAISAAAAAAWQSLGTCQVAARPDREAMRDLVIGAI